MPDVKSIRSAKGSAIPRSPAKTAAGRGDWRGKALRRVRELIEEADPEVIEERKWKKPTNPSGIPVWSHDGIICTGETYKAHVKLTFAIGASLEDPDGIFNSNLEGKVTRAIDIHKGEMIDESVFKGLIRAAVAANSAATNARAVPKK